MERLRIVLIVFIAIFLVDLIVDSINRNTSAIREQTEVLSHYNLIQAPERVESVVLFEHEGVNDE